MSFSGLSHSNHRTFKLSDNFPQFPFLDLNVPGSHIILILTVIHQALDGVLTWRGFQTIQATHRLGVKPAAENPQTATV